MRIPSVILTFVVLVLLCVAGEPGQESNLISNAGFEEVPAGGGLPKDWEFGKVLGTAEPLTTCNFPHGGRLSPGIEVQAGATAWLGCWASRVVEGGNWYRLSVWVRTEGTARAVGSISQYSPDKKKWLTANYRLFSLQTQGKWQRATAFYQVPPGERALRIGLWVKDNNAGGRAWFDDIELRPVESVPLTLYVPSNPAPSASAKDRARGFIVFNHNYLDLMPPSYQPSEAEIRKPFHIAAARDEYEPVSVGVYALEDIDDLRVEPPEFRSDRGARISEVDVRIVRYLVKRSHYSLYDRTLVPTYLEQGNILRVAKGHVGQFWLTVHVPTDAVPGEYRGTFRLTRANGRGEMLVPVMLRVHPFKLDEPCGMAFGMYDGLQVTHPGPDPILAKYRDMRAHGMTTVGYCGNLGAALRVKNEQVEVLFEGKPGLETVLDAYVRAGFPEPIVWLMGNDVHQFCANIGPLESEKFGEAYKAIIRAVLAEGKRRGWPEILFQPEDEVFCHTELFKSGFRKLKLLKEIPGVRTEMDGTNARNELPNQTYPFTDVLVHAGGPMLVDGQVYTRTEWLDIVNRYHRDGKRIWFYNFDTTGYHPESMRFAAGLYMLWSNADGLMSWAYSWGDARPYDDYGPSLSGDWMFFYPPQGEHMGGPSLGWEGLREGVDDFRYARTLMNRIAVAERSGNPRRKALARKAREEIEAWLGRLDLSHLCTDLSMRGNWTDQTLASNDQPTVSGSFKLNIGISFDDYDRFRSMCAKYIEALK